MKDNSLGIIQPGKLGDLIIVLPAAKYLHDKGYTVHWPVYEQFADMFNEVVDYVNFIPVTNNVYKCVEESYKKLHELNVTNIKDIAATFPGSTSTDEYVELGDGKVQPFDVFKYDKLGVPIDEKWNITVNRNHKEEDKLYNKLVHNEKYAVVCMRHSRGELNVKFDKSDGQVVHITDEYNIFYWLKILENAHTIALVESSMSNLVEQFSFDCKKILFRKIDNYFMKLPVMKNKWKIV